ncbi:glycosyltransferase [Saccharothrix syringae]|uniref:Glycosyltransferase n=1 Tax=Saccharothrix syringae TaxID=103733 RepID=A0A5Q0GY67_SACSY|nr:glycosyltransferase [Saccharothrix syringae]QFZ18878.1 glycosyltransferase [Saccharothrix syringae]
MGSSTRCTVIVPTYNREGLLRLTLASLAAQDLHRDRFEVLVVDDGSTDGTANAVREFDDRVDLRYFHQPDEGFRVARARNVGIRHARNEICVFVDSGVLLHSTSLSAHVTAHEATPEPLALNGYVYCFNLGNEDARLIRKAVDTDDVDSTIESMARTGAWPDVREPFYTRYSDDFGHLPAPWLMYWTCHASARTEQVRAVGMFDEAFRQWGGEDLDLAYRLHRDGARFGVDRAARSLHYPHDKDHGDNSRSARENYRYIAEKYRTPITRLLTEEPAIRFSLFNEVIAERGLPTCADYLARAR